VGELNGNPPDVTLSLTFDATTRQVAVNANVDDEMVLLYMLEKARDAIKVFCAKKANDSRIVPASAMPMIRN
jgi:hypothetical protein